MKVFKCVADADRVCALIKDEIESHDAGDYPDEQELIEIQEDRDEEPEKEPEEHMWMHTHDGGGSFIWTPKGTGIWPYGNTLTRFSEKRKLR